jgi:hypothetical protein
MALSPETARRLNQASKAGDHREIRIRFETRAALLDAVALAQKETWIEDCQVVLPRRELIIRMAGGFSVRAGEDSAPRRVVRGPLSVAG